MDFDEYFSRFWIGDIEILDDQGLSKFLEDGSAYLHEIKGVRNERSRDVAELYVLSPRRVIGHLDLET